MIAWLRERLCSSPQKIGLSQPYAEQTAEWEGRVSELTACGHSSAFEMTGSAVPEALRWQLPGILETLVSPIKPYVTELSGGRVHSHHATIFDQSGKILADLSDAFVPEGDVWNTATHSIASKGRLPVPEKWRGDLVVVSSPYSNNYYHWLFDTLPRLDAVVCHGSSKLYVNQYRSFQRDSLKMLGLPPGRLVLAEEHRYLRADTLLVPSLPFPPLPAPPSVWRLPVVSAEACRFLREELAARAMSGETVARHPKLYIRRIGTRAIANEKDIWSVLSTLGFYDVRLETLSMSEQIALFSQAEVVVGVHGAGLANVVFCPPGAKVVELMPSAWAMPCYWSVSRHVGLDYHRLDVSSVSAAGVTAGASSRVVVNVDQLKNVLS